MRNLKNTQHLVLQETGALTPGACSWDVTSDSVICAYGPTKDSPIIELKRWSIRHTGDQIHTTSTIASWDSPPPNPELETDTILDLRYFPDTGYICLVLLGGDIVLVRETPLDGEDKIEIVGSVDCGISAAAWAPDEELLAIVTNEDTILYMSRDFDLVTTITLQLEDLKASKHVNVGWGKAETQFKGRGAKALRDPTMPERVDEGVASTLDDGSTTISWRGDGSFVAVNSRQSSSRRVIRVFSRDGVLDGVSEPMDYMDSSLTWRPAGNLMASIQRLEDQIKVVFFERNGLRHGEFPLRLSQEEIMKWGSSIKMLWNNDSTVLAIIFKDRFQLWTMGNYHYYLKQELKFAPSGTVRTIPFAWHPEQPLLLTLGSDSTDFQRLEYVWSVSRGQTALPADNGTVAVIDGTKVKLTHFRYEVVPPPMSTHELQVDDAVIDVAVFDNSRSLCIVAALTSTDIYVFQMDPSKAQNSQVDLSIKAPLSSAGVLESPDSNKIVQQIEVLGQEIVQVLLSNGTRNEVCTVSVPRNESPSVQSRISASSLREIHPGTLGTGSSRYPISLWNGEVTLADTKTRLSSLSLDTSIEHTEIVSSVTHAHDATIDGMSKLQDFAVTLTKSGLLYANDRCISKSCTSFITTPTHIIFTTTQHLLKFVHTDNVSELEIPPDTPEADERCRAVERGSRIVTAFPSRSAVVLQMPRGNLETVFPRALVLAEIRRHINANAMKRAFMYCRDHRVDMNILHDHDPDKFISGIGSFIDQIQKVEHIDLFLSQLREEDVSVTMYKETVKRKDLPRNKATAATTVASDDGTSTILVPKVNRICDAFLQNLRTRRGAHTQNIITAHCCKSPPDLESGLLEVAKIQTFDSTAAERAVEHICFLADVNRLYDTALGLYNLKLALLVAQQSQKDPREYLPFLQKLQDHESSRMKYSIDDHLGRRNKALKHLHDLGEFDEVKTYMVRHGLYEDALKLYRYKENNIKEIMKLYADHLSETAKHEQAGLAYEYLQDFSAASEAYRLAHKWQEALSCASLVPLSNSQLQELAKLISESLYETKNYFAAAVVQLDYLHDAEAAARFFCKGYHFADAFRVISMQNRPELLETIIDVGLVEAMATVTDLIADCRGQLNAQVPRIKELREKKADAPLSYMDGDANGDANIPDNVSLAETAASTMGGSLFTRYTNRTGTVATNTTRQTSKNRRREERKKARGKKGSAYEEEYLVNSVGRLFERVNSMIEEVKRLVTGLLRRGMRERAGAIDSGMLTLVESCKAYEMEVFERARLVGTTGSADDTEVEKGAESGQTRDAGTPSDQPQGIRIRSYGRAPFLGP